MVTDFIWNLSAWSVAHSVCCECRLWTCLRREGEWKDNSLRTGSNNSVLTVFGNLDISSQERNLMPIVLCVDWTMKQQDDPCYRSPEMITWVRTSAVLSSSPTSGHANWEPVHLCKHQACSSSTSGSTQRGCFVLFCSPPGTQISKRQRVTSLLCLVYPISNLTLYAHQSFLTPQIEHW